MSKKFYFEHKNAEICYQLDHFKKLLISNDLKEMILFEAKEQYTTGYFWCSELREIGDKDEGGCGRDCEFYKPKNGKSGCCKHYSVRFYKPSDKTIIIKKKL